MSIQLSKVLTVMMLLSYVFFSYSGDAKLPDNEWQESIKNFVASFPNSINNMSPTTIVGVCIATILLAIVFRGLIFFVIMFGILVVMFGSTEKVVSYLKEKFDFVKGIDSVSSIMEEEKDKKNKEESK